MPAPPPGAPPSGACCEMAAGRLVVVSGANRGVGLGIVHQLLQLDRDTHVAVLARNLLSAEQACASLEGGSSRAHAVQCDVTDDASCQAAAATIATLGGSSLMALVNNAGVAVDLPWFPTPWPARAAADTLAVNLWGAARLTRALEPQLLAAEDGRVIFVSSGGGRANMRRMAPERREQLYPPIAPLPPPPAAALPQRRALVGTG